MLKFAQLSASLQDVQAGFMLSEIKERWSPRAFASEKLTEAQIELLLESARWAPSCMNEQPWRFLVFERGTEAHEKAATYLNGGNYWAKQASHLILVCAHTRFAASGQPNRHAYYDTGAAVMALTLQAQHMGIYLHQMGGFDVEQLTRDLNFPEHAHPVAMVAVGFKSPDVSELSEKHQELENAPRQRKPLSEISHCNRFSLDGLF